MDELVFEFEPSAVNWFFLLLYFAQTAFTCDLGYVSSSSPTAPYYNCTSSTNTTGLWSAVQGTCNGTRTAPVSDTVLYSTHANATYLHTLAVIAPYCNSSTAPSTSNANSPTPQTQVSQQTNFNCYFGYTSSGGATSPYYTCNTLNSTMGQWSVVTYGCICMLLSSTCHRLRIK